ncbi:ParB/RepB/Spo0J family partition protein [Thermosediminibacter oceani]|uniref:Chromosome segregation DNA-binding protein n=1 Tax=Thermosediminibacter oceani (strain ATCC BAA-1034 / DSM 16646 / JW/IW-1228P) TaxID=555079 RepID=D9S1A5_THEOJ|nr:ParB/RepB/Spo0J family partition protein [Thermosediminibacter oceani]ADL08984.1 chromosome segregation DNA-binding protein [Thermosediminibacter oceani DSM 16646]
MTKKGLGRGLGALIPMMDEKTDEKNIQEISISEIRPNEHQPRKAFDDEKLSELAASIKEHGVLQPVILRKVKNGYEIVAGERRWRAARIAGIDKIPAVVKELTDAEVMQIALIENLQREDLNPLEEAAAYKRLMEEFGMTQEELAARIGKSRSQIANTVRLLNLEPEIQQMIKQGRLTAGHARALLAVDDPRERMKIARRITEENISVRETEEIAKTVALKAGKKREKGRGEEINPALLHVTEQLQKVLGTKVRVKGSERKGRIEIEFYSEDELERILEIIIGS